MYLYTGDEITGGKVYVRVKGRGGLSFLNIKREKDLCDVLPDGCPVAKGDTTITTEVDRKISGLAPAVSYQNLKMYSCEFNVHVHVEDVLKQANNPKLMYT